jgi:phosphoribosylformylglycinamidine cyclo-ligase
MNYSKAGVNIDLGNRLKSSIPNIAKNATRPEVLGKIGGFGGLFKLDTSKYKNPILVSSTDGVGSKLKLAFKYDTHYDAAHDLVNHCVNDIIVTGAEPLFFLDYIGMNKLNEEVFNELISGFSDACSYNNCALIGGETAQLPDLYADNEYDLSGTIVGVVDQDKILDGSKVIEGDYIIGLQSNGLHTNGYTLARKALGDNLVDKYAGELLSIHLSYFKAFNACRQYIKAAAHITGGGLIDNIPRTLPPQFKAVIQKRSWTVPDIFKRIQAAGNIPDEEMYKVFNMGIGMTWIVSVDEVNYCVAKLSEYIPSTIIGRIEKRNNNVVLE